MSPAERVIAAHRVTGNAIAELCRLDNEIGPERAGKLVAYAALASVRGCSGSEAAAETAYVLADNLAVTPG